MPCDPNTLIEEAKCLQACIPYGMMPAVTVAALCNVATAAAAGGGAASADLDWVDTSDHFVVMYGTGGQITEVGQQWTYTAAGVSGSTPTVNRLPARSMTTGGGVGNELHAVPFTNQIAMLGYRDQVVFLTCLDSILDLRYFMVVTDLGGVAQIASAAPVGNYVGFRFDTGAGDTSFMAITANGGAPTLVATGVVPSITTTQYFRMEWDRNGTAVRFYIDNVLVATIATTLPASGTFGGMLIGIKSLAGHVNVVFISGMKARESVLA
jgi:hypothetical protein